MNLSDLNPFKSVIDTVGGVIKEFIEDPDEANKLTVRMQEILTSAVGDARAHDKATYGGGAVDAVRGLVRPVITFMFSGMYVVAKLAPSAGITFTEYDYAVLGVVLTFWFGERLLQNRIKK